MSIRLILCLLLMYIEHLVIFWSYSFVWLIAFRKRIFINAKDAKNVALHSMRIQLYVLPICGCVFYYLYNKLDHQQIIFTKPKFNLFELSQWICMVLWEDFIFYHVHRLLHLPTFYNLHKLHHSWIEPVPWEAMYASVPENILANFFPMFIAPLIVGLNIYYLMVWVALSTFASLISHSNIIGDHHTLHHKHFNVNYGVLGIFDKIYGTDQSE